MLESIIKNMGDLRFTESIVIFFFLNFIYELYFKKK